MPPKAKRRGAPLYRDAMSYYKGAYRARIKAIRNWTTAEITSTLAWMWMHASGEEQQRSRTLLADRAQTLPATDDSTIPTDPKTRDSPAPVPAGGSGAIGGPIGGATSGATGHATVGAIGHATGGAASIAGRANTTSLAHWPDPATLAAELPNVTEDRSENKEDREAEKRSWLEAGLHDPEREPDQKRWHGVYFLGQGAKGRAGLWVRLDESHNIDEMIAARDVATMSPRRWTDPVSWRDQLPREIAIQLRLNEQKGHDHNVHRYFGHRISFWQRRYRVFNEVCGLGDLYSALSHYSRLWRRRRNMFRWLETHPEIGNARDNYEDQMGFSEEEDAEQQLQEVTDATWIEYTTEKTRRKEDEQEGITRKLNEGTEHFRRTNAEYDDMSEIEEWNGQELPKVPSAVIDEAFLWYVFDALATALLVLKNGNNVTVDGKEWKEIVHKDLHLGNVFVKPPEKGGGGIAEEYSTDTDYVIQYARSEWPRVVLADWDQAFFDLQSAEDAYADNPLHYAIGGNVKEADGRYPPELFWDYEGHQDGFEKLTSQTDVWGLGQMMWNLVMQNNNLQEPFFDDNGTAGNKLVSGERYSHPTPKNLLSGNTPFEASQQYSNELKDLIRRCLRYRQTDRPSVEAVKARTAKALGKTKSREDVFITVSSTLHDFRIGEGYPRKKRRVREEGSESQ